MTSRTYVGVGGEQTQRCQVELSAMKSKEEKINQTGRTEPEKELCSCLRAGLCAEIQPVHYNTILGSTSILTQELGFALRAT